MRLGIGFPFGNLPSLRPPARWQVMQELPRLPKEVEAKIVAPLLMAFCIASSDVVAEAQVDQNRIVAVNTVIIRRVIFSMVVFLLSVNRRFN